jgi:hypothetical protein
MNVSKNRRQCMHLASVKAVTPSSGGCDDWSWCLVDEIQVFLP